MHNESIHSIHTKLTYRAQNLILIAHRFLPFSNHLIHYREHDICTKRGLPSRGVQHITDSFEAVRNGAKLPKVLKLSTYIGGLKFPPNSRTRRVKVQVKNDAYSDILPHVGFSSSTSVGENQMKEQLCG